MKITESYGGTFCPKLLTNGNEVNGVKTMQERRECAYCGHVDCESSDLSQRVIAASVNDKL